MSTTTAPGPPSPPRALPLRSGLLTAGPQGVRAGPQGVRAGPQGVRAAPPDAVDNATLDEREDVSPTVARFVVRPDGPMPPFAAGQYVALGLRVQGRLVQRPYSTASGPRTAGAHELLVRLVPDGVFTPALWRLQVGARLRLGRPKGTFILESDDDRTHLFVASGTGLAPFVAMARDLLERPAPPPIVLVHGVGRAEDLAYRDLLADHDAAGSLAYVPTVSRPRDPGSTGWDGRTGRTEIAAAEVAATLDPTTTVAYLCGNPGMVETVSRLLGDQGFGDVRAESFWDGRGEGTGVAARRRPGGPKPAGRAADPPPGPARGAGPAAASRAPRSRATVSCSGAPDRPIFRDIGGADRMHDPGLPRASIARPTGAR